ADIEINLAVGFHISGIAETATVSLGEVFIAPVPSKASLNTMFIINTHQVGRITQAQERELRLAGFSENVITHITTHNGVIGLHAKTALTKEVLDSKLRTVQLGFAVINRLGRPEHHQRITGVRQQIVSGSNFNSEV